MTKEEISRIKEHIETHARREPHAIKITEIMRKAVAELEQNIPEKVLPENAALTMQLLLDTWHNGYVCGCAEKRGEAKEIIKKLYSHVFQGKGFMELNDYNVQKAEAEQFLQNGGEGGCGVKGFEIRRENEEPFYLFNRQDVVSAIAHALYYAANPESDMCVPNCAYERAEKEFDDWLSGTRAKKAAAMSRAQAFKEEK